MTNAAGIIYVNVLASGSITGPGPLANIIRAQYTQELDRAGQIAITVPATDDRAISLLANENELHIYTTEGIQAKGFLQTYSVQAGGEAPSFILTGTDLLGELRRLTTGYDLTYDDQAVDSVIIGTDATATSLLGGTGWTQGSVSIDADNTPNTITFNAESRLSALITLAAMIGHHLREGSTSRTLDFGVFGADSGLRVVNVNHFLVGQVGNVYQGYISRIAADTISADIENRMFPLGKDKFDMRDATDASADILVKTSFGLLGFATTADGNSSGATIPVTATTSGGLAFRVGETIWIGDADDWTADHEYGTIESISAGVSITLTAALANSYAAGADVIQRPQFYIEDTTSIASYGARESTPQFGWIGFSDTAVDETLQQQAADSLYQAAQARMTRFKDPYTNYVIGDIYDLPTTLRVGQKIRVSYVGAAGVKGTSFLDVEDDFYVMGITRVWDGAGTGTGRGVTTLNVANVSRPSPNNENLILYNLDNGKWTSL